MIDPVDRGFVELIQVSDFQGDGLSHRDRHADERPYPIEAAAGPPIRVIHGDEDLGVCDERHIRVPPDWAVVAKLLAQPPPDVVARADEALFQPRACAERAAERRADVQ